MYVYLEVDDMLETKLSKRIFTLGRVCCRQKCDCEWVMYDYDEFEKLELIAKSTIVSPITLANGYECSSEHTRCMQHCRAQASTIISTIEPSLVDIDESTQQNDLLESNELTLHLCKIIKQKKPAVTTAQFRKNGFQIYVRYTNENLMTHPHREDINVGRVCCRFVDKSIIATNRCNETVNANRFL